MKLSHVFLVGMLSLLVACSNGSGTTDILNDNISGIDSSGRDAEDVGGGSDNLSSSDTTNDDITGIDGSGKDSGGIDGSGFDCGGDSCKPVIASGAIDSFGSIIVDGVRYIVPDNTVIQTCSGRETITAEDLSLGDYIQLAGIKHQDGISGSVDQINVCPIVCGSVEVVQSVPGDSDVNPSEKLITFLGKKVLVSTEETVFDGGTFETLNQGDQICAFGYGLESELVFATRVEYQAVESALFVATIEEVLDGNGQLRMSNGLTVVIDGATETIFTNGSVAAGLRVEVTGALNGTVVTASSVREVVSPLSLQLEPNQTVIVEGAIDRLTDSNSLTVEGLAVQLPSNYGQTPPFFNLEKGLQLLIEAQNTDAGISAQSIFIKRIEEEGTITAIDTDNSSITVELLRFGQSMEFSVNDTTQIFGPANETMTLAQLNVGDEVDLVLVLNEAQQYIAKKIERISQFTGSSSVDPVAVTVLPTRTIDGAVSADEPLSSQSVVIDSNGELNLILNSAEQYGRLIATESMTLAGTLQVTLNFTPSAGDSFSLLSWGSLIGGSSFEDVQLSSLPASLAWDLSNLYTTGEIQVIQAPGGIDVAAAFWIDASDMGINYADGDQVYRWIDKSGNNRNLDAPVDTRRPVYSAASINSLPGIVFTDDSLSDRNNDLFWSNLGDHTILFVSRQTVASSVDVPTTGTYYYIRGGSSFYGLTTQTDALVGESLTLDSVGPAFNRRLAFSPANLSWQANDDILFTITSSTNNGTRLFKDGTLAIFDLTFQATASDRLSPSDAGANDMEFMLGSNQVTSFYRSNFSISEILVYEGELSNENMRAVEAYLSSKYNLVIE